MTLLRRKHSLATYSRTAWPLLPGRLTVLPFCSTACLSDTHTHTHTGHLYYKIVLNDSPPIGMSSMTSAAISASSSSNSRMRLQWRPFFFQLLPHYDCREQRGVWVCLGFFLAVYTNKTGHKRCQSCVEKEDKSFEIFIAE